jgi:hypothetical protein
LYLPVFQQPASGHAQTPGRSRAIGTVAELGAVVVMVTVVEAGLPLGVTLAGEKPQPEAAGNPLQEKVMAELKPLTGLTVIVKVAVWPALIVAAEGDAETVKSAGALPITMVALAVAGARTASPGYSAEIV